MFCLAPQCGHAAAGNAIVAIWQRQRINAGAPPTMCGEARGHCRRHIIGVTASKIEIGSTETLNGDINMMRNAIASTVNSRMMACGDRQCQVQSSIRRWHGHVAASTKFPVISENTGTADLALILLNEPIPTEVRQSVLHHLIL